MKLNASAAAALLRSADPVPGTGTGLDERAKSDLRRIVASSRPETASPQAARRPRARLLAAAAATAAIAFGRRGGRRPRAAACRRRCLRGDS